MKKCISLGGSLAAEHGIGLEKIDYIAKKHNNFEIEEFYRIKEYFDKNNHINPGKILPEKKPVSDFVNKKFDTNREEAQSIVDIFNNNETIKQYKNVGSNVDAKVKKRNIVVSFNESNYAFKINDNYLETTISKDDSIGKIITMIMADSIAVKLGSVEKSTYEFFNQDTVYNMTLEQGILYTSIGTDYNIKLNLKTYIK